MKLAEISVRRPVFATVLVGALVVFGVTSYSEVGVDLFPEVEFPVLTITAVYPGADPETVESRIVDPLEEAVNTVNGIKVLRSTSSENVGFIIVEFELEREIDKAAQDVRDKVSSVLAQLPPDLEPPVVAKFDVGATPILQLVVSGDLPRRELTKVAEDVVKARLQSIIGVGSIALVGAQSRQFHVWLDPWRLDALHMTPMDVVQALAGQNVEIPGGRIDVGDQELVVKTHGQVHSREGLEDIVITSAGGRPIRVGDVADVEDGEQELRTTASLNGEQALALIITKQGGANTVAVAREVRRALGQLRSALPEGIGVAVAIDESTFIEHAIHDVQFDLAFGALLAIVIIMFFLHDWRATFISALALPTSVVATFAFIHLMGFTFNMMSMLALSLSIGILIDDAIVVIENIHRHLEMGKRPFRAAYDGASEIGLAVAATTASIVAVFVPVAIMEGIVGRFFLQFGLTVAFAVAVSFVVAFTLTPAYSARLLKGHDGKKKMVVGRAIEWFLQSTEDAYRGVIRWSLNHKIITLAIATGSLVGSFALVAKVPFEFMPPEDRGQFKVSVEYPPGTAFGETSERIVGIENKLQAIPGVTQTFVTVGGGARNEVNKAAIVVSLVPRGERAFDQKAAINYAREVLQGEPDALIAVGQLNVVGGNSSGMRSAQLQFNLRGGSYDELNAHAATLIDKMKASGGYVDIDTTFRGGKPELGVEIDRDRAADLGVPVAVLAQTIRLFYAGQKATEITVDGDRHDVRVRLAEEYRKDPDVLTTLNVRTGSGMTTPMENSVIARRGEGPAAIDRQARQRQVTIYANLEGKALGAAVQEVEGFAKALPGHIVTDWAGMGDVMQESAVNMGKALVLAVILIFLILAAQFESFIHPLSIMASLPLSLIGAIGGLYLTGMSLNIFSMIGFIMLMGLVTKNAILMVDYTNTLRDEGMERFEALIEAGAVRLRPILMTTGAMVFGMLPVALALSEGGEQRAPMAVAVIGGLITSTLLTLVVVPVAYQLLDAISEKLFGERKGRTADIDAMDELAASR
ncbi:MAG: acriflavin resistance protein [Proteobacteria bacterium]|nr:MAG: acriflavin resistance protein [Pseudomonadota bacterium]